MLTDLRFAFRQLAKSPGFTVVAVATLALGIGACTAIFSVVHCVLLRPLAYPESERLVVLRERKLPQYPQFSVAPGQYFYWRDHAKSFEHLAAVHGRSFNLTGFDEPQRLIARGISANYLATLGVHPAIGRDFTAEEDAPGQADVVILSHGFWLRQFGGRPDVLHTTLQLDGRPFTIVGIMPKSFQADTDTELFTPLALPLDQHDNHGGHYIGVVGRLRPGVTIDQARTEINLLADRLARQFPDTNKGWDVILAPMLESTVAGIRPVLYSLLGAVGFLLLLACANVANLLLARATARSREILIRTVLGAAQGRIVRQLLTESLLLSLLGAALGLLVAQWGMSALLALAPDALPRARDISVDSTALAFTCALALLTGVGFGIVPAFQAARIDLNDTLKDASRGSSEGHRRRRVRSTLVVAEVAISLMLLVGAGLLIRSFARLQDVDPGFQPRDAWTVRLSLPDRKYATDAQLVAFVDRASTSLAAIPGVQSVGVSHVVPFTGGDHILGFAIAGQPAVAPSDQPEANYYAVTPDYFKAMGISLLRGRTFDAHDVAGAPHVALINETLAKRLFPHQDPIGQRINIINGSDAWREIVGVVGDVKHYGLDASISMQTYEPFAQAPLPYLTFVVRTAGPVTGLPAAIRRAIYAVDPEQPVANTRPLTELVSASVARRRFAMLLFVVFSAIALLLAMIGIYGVMACAVSQRRTEIGIRLALGAQSGDVLKLVLAQGARLILLGLAAGLIGALLLSRFLNAMLFGVSPHDPVTFVAIATLLGAVATAACLIPARRAIRVDPIESLRAD